MLWALLFALLFGGSSESPLLDYIDTHTRLAKEHVTEKPRLKNVLHIFDEMEDTGKKFQKKRLTAKKKLLKKAKHHESNADDFKIELDQLMHEADNTESALLELRFKLKDVMTREEWNAVFNQQSRK